MDRFSSRFRVIVCGERAAPHILVAFFHRSFIQEGVLMIRLIFWTVVSSIALWPQEGLAAVISHDWKTPGDGLLTYDDVNQREWLDLSQSLLSAQFPGVDRNERYDYVIQQTNPSGIFAGFAVAKSLDVSLFAQSAGIDISTHSYPINANRTLALGELLSYTVDSTITGSKFAVGLLDEFGGPENPGQFGAKIGVSFAVRAGLQFTNNDDLLFLPPPGVMLFRNIPEPTALVLIMFVFWAVAIIRHNGV
jgi:hypothetical protein